MTYRLIEMCSLPETAATGRLEEVEGLKQELVKMQGERRTALAELTRDKEATRQQLGRVRG
jgi:hypothetical protein